MAVGVDVRGMPEVMAALDGLGGKHMNAALQKASTAGAKAIKPYVQAEAPRRKGKLRRAVSARKAKRDLPAAVVSARPKVAFYRHMVIGGTKPHRIRFHDQKAAGVPKSQGNIQHPGARSNPFVERGFEKGEDAALRAIDAVIDAYLESL
jgi:hypothetical protein